MSRRTVSLVRAFAAPAMLVVAFLLCAASGPKPAVSHPAQGLDSVQAIQARLADAKSRGKKTGWLEAYLYWYQQRAFPNSKIDWAAYGRGLEQARRMPVGRLSGAG